MNRNIIEDLLDRYFKGETSQEENELVENWLDKNGNSPSEWQYFNQNQKDEWLAGTYSDIQNSIRTNSPKVVTMSERKFLWRRIAAAAVFIIAFALYLEWPVLQNRLFPVQLAVLNVPLNQKKQITLADGSRIWVNAGSELKYPKNFNRKTREVYLSGEAFFDIKHDVSKPFIVHTGELTTTVLGTAFNIKEDKSLNTIAVTVSRGKVSVSNGRKLLGFITPNQQISFNSLNNKSIQTEVNANQVIAWQEKELRFEDITFGEAALQLGQRFNVKISFANNKVKECKFTGTALICEKLEKVLKVICAFNNATYQIKPDGSIMIDGPGCN